MSANQIGGHLSDVPKNQNEVCNRVLALSALVSFSHGADLHDVLDWLRDESILQYLSLREKAFLASASSDESELTRYRWQVERLAVLLWALSKIDALPPANTECSSDTVIDLLPPYNERSISDFHFSAKLRSPEELMDFAVSMQDLHATAIQRLKNPNYRSQYGEIDIEVISERQIAANWLMGYCGLDWDNVTADT